MSHAFAGASGGADGAASGNSDPVGVAPALVVRGLRKSYGGARALVGADLTVERGQVHALIGQNGCGKSTLVKCLTGVVTPDDGTVELFGKPLTLPVTAPHRHGIAVIHQDIGLANQMSVLDNVAISAGFGGGALFPIAMTRERLRQRQLLERLGVRIDLDALVASLSPAERALVGLMRAMRLMDESDGERIGGDIAGTSAVRPVVQPDWRREPVSAGRLFILDEPTAALSGPEAARVLELARRVADLGNGVLFISHRLAEVIATCDAVTVMRDGADVISTDVASTTRGDLVASMLGRRMDDFYPAPPVVHPTRERLAVSGLSGQRLQTVSLVVRDGEVVGVTGLAGMGQEELPMLISGAKAASAGSYAIDGRSRDFTSPGQAITAGLAMVPGDRIRDGLWLNGTVEENVTLTAVGRLSSRARLARRALRSLSQDLVRRFGIQPSRTDMTMATLSGGNQQKVVFAKWLLLKPVVLILDEPIQGVDPGAARDLLQAVMDLAAQGSAVVVCSGDHELLSAICHRVIVIHHGKIITELSNSDLTESALLAACQAAPSEVVVT